MLSLNLAQADFHQVPVVDKLHAQLISIFECVFLKGTLAEAVNGIDVGLVEGIESGLKAPPLFRILSRPLFESEADAAFQLARGLLGVRNQENLFQANVCLHEQAEHQLFDCVGLARARRRLDDAVALEIDLHHGPPPSARRRAGPRSSSRKRRRTLSKASRGGCTSITWISSAAR